MINSLAAGNFVCTFMCMKFSYSCVFLFNFAPIVDRATGAEKIEKKQSCKYTFIFVHDMCALYMKLIAIAATSASILLISVA